MGVTDTVTTVSAESVTSCVAVTVTAPPFSDMAESDSVSVTSGASSSVMVSVAPVADRFPAYLSFCAVAFTENCLSASRLSLSTAVMVTVPVLLRCPAGMVSVVLADRA